MRVFVSSTRDSGANVGRARVLFERRRQDRDIWADRAFATLLIVEWLFEIGLALWISPRTWAGTSSAIHPHVWTAVFLGGAAALGPLALVIVRPGQFSTRLVVALMQGLMTAIMIHLTGGRIETHFSVFVSLALLAFYCDWRVLVATSLVVAVDHFVRGIFWPQSVYGISVVSPWRFLEHTAWVLLEDSFLYLLIRQSLIEQWLIAERQADLEVTNGEIVLINAQLRGEVAERRRAQQALEMAKSAAEASSRAKSEFLANMSHELRTPLNAVIGFSDILHEQVSGPLNDEQRQYVADILESGQHLLSLVNDVLDLAKIESGTSELQRGAVQWPRLVDRTIRMFRERAVRQGVRLFGDAEACCEPFEGDERRLKQLLYNLVSNAIKFTPDGGEVRVTAHQADHLITLTVTDSGVGIPKEEHEKIFHSFYQVDSTLTKYVQGTGLGLALVRQIAEMHGGRVRVESAPGEGSSFIVTLPNLSEPQPEDTLAPAPQACRPVEIGLLHN